MLHLVFSAGRFLYRTFFGPEFRLPPFEVGDIVEIASRDTRVRDVRFTVVSIRRISEQDFEIEIVTRHGSARFFVGDKFLKKAEKCPMSPELRIDIRCDASCLYLCKFRAAESRLSIFRSRLLSAQLKTPVSPS